MKKLTFLITFLFVISYSSIAQNDNLKTRLFELPDVIFSEVDEAEGFKEVYKLYIKQPLDHSDHTKGFFYQKAFLSHKGFDRPMVMVTEGYSNPRNWNYELTNLLEANQISVEHRYFGESLPDSLNYDYLNLEQATADLHHINQLFREIYDSKWISTGISKGGATTIFYKYYYPKDVEVSVPYVAPINRSFEDTRIYDFLDAVGTEDCRNKIAAFQRRILKNREKALPLLNFYSKGAKVDYDYLSLEQAFEYAVLEYSFSFWQYGHDCEKIPNESASLEEALDYLLGVSNIIFFSDRDIERYGAHYFQSAEEMGYYGYETEDFKDLLKALPHSHNPHATFVPGKLSVKFDDTLLKKVNKWLRKNGSNIIYINGAIDTWSATAVPKNDKVDSVWFFMDGKHHGNARIKNMSKDEKQLLIATLEKWLKMKIKAEDP